MERICWRVCFSCIKSSKSEKCWGYWRWKYTRVIVDNSQLSLAIGKNGQNARLAAKLTGMRVDIKTENSSKDDSLEGEQSE